MQDSETVSIWLCDLTYTQQTIASDIMPAAVGSIATFTEEFLKRATDIAIFKFPDRLIEALENRPPPQVIGFSNYAWNQNLSSSFAAVIKKHLPKTVVVFGGPNYPTIKEEQERFLRLLPMVDFYVVKEGEVGFAKLVEALIDRDFDLDRVPADIPSVHRVTGDGSFCAADTEERIWDLTQIPSPYLTGKMDEFFDGVMLPIIQTNRGCPFRCTFCVEGLSYYSRVAKTARQKIDSEIRYIAEKMAGQRKEKAARTDLHIADSNFGMYKEDLDTCRTIAEMQRDYGYPEYINVATGKNHKKRVLESARMLGGALRLSGSVQSLDKTVLKNIDRSNINEGEIMSLALEASDIGANAYSEIILGLPGDSVEAHFNTIRTVVEADFNTVCLYQLMLLPGTDLASDESKRKWGMVTRYRVLPRCYGYFDYLGKEINSAEIEEICISNDSLSFDDYLACRRFHLFVNVFYNDGVFKEVLRLIQSLGLSKFDFLERLYNYRGNAEMDSFVGQFLDETRNELWDSRECLEAFVRDRRNINSYIDGELGANLIFKYRSLSLIQHTGTLAEVCNAALEEILNDHGQSEAVELGKELVEFARLRMTDIFQNLDTVRVEEFSYDVDRFSRDLKPGGVKKYRLNKPVRLSFILNETQKKTMQGFLSVYGDSLAGLSRIMATVYMRRLFREPIGKQGHTIPSSTQERVAEDATSTGLNQFT